MMSLVTIASYDCVVIGRQYLARIAEKEYRVVRPINTSYKDGDDAFYKNCEYICDSGEVFFWNALAELAEII